MPAENIEPSGPSPTETRAPFSRDQRLVLWIAIVASFVAFLDTTVVGVALPAIREELGGGLATQQWVQNSYMITLGAFILIAGSMSDTFGRIRVIRAGLVGFGITSIAIAVAPTTGILIAARLLQGAAGALLVPSSLALITSTFKGASQGRAIGIWTAATTGAMVIGPLLGGGLVDLASWRWAFAINVFPIAVVMWLLRRLGTHEVKRDDASVDMLGAALCAIGLGGIVYAFIESEGRGWDDSTVWVSTVVGAAALVAFLWHQARARAPMMPLGLFRVRNFGWGNLATFFIYGGLSLVGFAIGIYLQEQAGLSATAAGAAQLPIIVMMVALSSKAGELAGQWGPRIFMTVGPLVTAAGALFLLAVSPDFNYWTQVLPGMALVGLGLALTVAPLTSAILGAIESARSGIASAVNNAVSRIAGLMTVALVGTITAGTLDLDGMRRTAVVTAALLVVGGLVSWTGIRNRPNAE